MSAPSNKLNMEYKDLTLEKLEEALRDYLYGKEEPEKRQDYVVRLTPAQYKEFDKAMQEEGRKISMVDYFKPMQIAYNKKMAGLELTDDEKELLGEKINEMNKYFTPDRTELRLGYECEIKFDSESEWRPFTLGESIVHIRATDTTYGGFLKIDQEIRVPYLTKEQIEGEGWSVENTGGLHNGIMNNRSAFRKNNYYCVYDHKLHIVQMILRDPSIEIEANWKLGLAPEHFRFNCECKDINTFRYICKLLHI